MRASHRVYKLVPPGLRSICHRTTDALDDPFRLRRGTFASACQVLWPVQERRTCCPLSSGSWCTHGAVCNLFRLASSLLRERAPALTSLMGLCAADATSLRENPTHAGLAVSSIRRGHYQLAYLTGTVKKTAWCGYLLLRNAA